MELKDSIALGAKYIQEGKLVAFPTETVYGLGANALDANAVAKIYEAKERPSFNPLIAHIADLEMLSQLTTRAQDPRVLKLAKAFWPGPLTLVLPKTDLVPEIVSAGLPTVGIRMPANEIALELIRQAGCPIAAPSANKFTRISPTSAEHVKKQLSKEVDHIIDGGQTTVGIESTIIRLTEKGFQLLRNGVITKEEIAKVIPWDETEVAKAVVAPGMIKSHYSPKKEMQLLKPERFANFDKTNAGFISFSQKYEEGYKKVIRVSENQDLKEYAVNMFAAMHQLEDDPEIELIIAEAVAEEGVGIAIMDRLKKAVHDWNTD
jgi:L-threonylcarbamoyladenylate synthase